MEEQDLALDQLAGTVSRMRHTALTIGTELDQQEPLLEEVERKVETASVRVGSATRRVEAAQRGARGKWMWWAMWFISILINQDWITLALLISARSLRAFI